MAQPGARGLIAIPYGMHVHAEQRTFRAGSATGRRSARPPAQEQEMSCHTSAGAASSMMRRACTDEAMWCLHKGCARAHESHTSLILG